jgi:2-dehydro-3-deoxyphosphooctonate aldolase (KDO 8-P synthase)
VPTEILAGEKMEQPVPIGDLLIGGKGPLFLIAGPCVIENEEITLEVAGFLREMKDLLQIPVIFKTSFDKANRTSLDSYRGPGIDKGAWNHCKSKREPDCPCSRISTQSVRWRKQQVLDVLQIPAFLCRQTDLLVAAARTGLALNIKKGQFLSPWDMAQAIGKVTSSGNRRLLLTERGTCFGYNNLVVDIRSIAIMKNFGFPVVFDATHSVQLPGGAGSSSGGQREFVGHLSRAAVAAGADGVFMEVHPHPESALCDGPNSIPLGEVRPLVSLLQELKALVSGR